MVSISENGPPFITTGKYAPGTYPSPSKRIGKAWAGAWAELSALAPGEYLDGTELAQRAAEPHGLKPVTVVSLLTRAATEGILERKAVRVETRRGPRTRTHYRVA